MKQHRHEHRWQTSYVASIREERVHSLLGRCWEDHMLQIRPRPISRSPNEPHPPPITPAVMLPNLSRAQQ